MSSVARIAFLTIYRKELDRLFRIAIQTIFPPVIMMSLYFIIFGELIGKRVGLIDGVSYIQFITPGLIMMSVITNSYAHVVGSFYSIRFQHNVDEILVSPTPNIIILLGFVAGGITRGLIIGALVCCVALFFTDLRIHHWPMTLTMLLMTATLFSLIGFFNAIFANSFDDISVIPTFVLAPLSYLGGIFYSVSMLPSVWQGVSMLNPILYMVNTLRYGFLGITDVPIVIAFIMVGSFIILMLAINLWLLEKGTGLRT